MGVFSVIAKSLRSTWECITEPLLHEQRERHLKEKLHGADLQHKKAELEQKRAEFAQNEARWRQEQAKRETEESQRFAQMLADKNYAFRLQNSWPLHEPPDALTLPHVRDRLTGQDMVPLRVIISDSNSSEYQRLFGQDAIERTKSFVITHLGPRSTHPVIFYNGGWRQNHHQGEAAIGSIHAYLKGQPTLVLTPVAIDSGDKLILRFASWGLGQNDDYPMMADLCEVPVKKWLTACARQSARVWRASKNAHQLPPELNPVDELNLNLLTTEERLLAKGVRPEEIDRLEFSHKYEFRPEHHSAVRDHIVGMVGAAVGLFADAHYALEYGRPPILRSLLPHLPTTPSLDSLAHWVTPIANGLDTFLSEETKRLPDLRRTPLDTSLSAVCSLLATAVSRELPGTKSNAQLFARRFVLDGAICEHLISSLSSEEQNSGARAPLIRRTIEILGEMAVAAPDDNLGPKIVEHLLQDEQCRHVLREIASRGKLILAYTESSARASWSVYSNKISPTSIANWLISADFADEVSKRAVSTKAGVDGVMLEADWCSATLASIAGKHVPHNIDRGEAASTLLRSELFVDSVRDMADLTAKW